MQKWYYSSLAGVTDIDFDDFYQEALKAAYEYKKKHPEFEFKANSIKFLTKDYMFDKRAKTNFNGKNSIINFEYELDNLELDKYTIQEAEKHIEIDYDKNTGINKLFDILDERSRFIIKHYIGYDGHSLTFKEIGSILNL